MMKIGDDVVRSGITNQYTERYKLGVKYTVVGVSKTGQFISLNNDSDHWCSNFYFEKLSDLRMKKIKSIYE